MAQFIFKIKFYSPQKDKAAGAKNAKHVQYIATRPGVDKGEVEIGDQEVEDQEKEHDGSSKPQNSITDAQRENASIHAKYMSERPGSSGLFGQKDYEKPDLKETMKELDKHKGIVWRTVISLREDDAKKLGFTNREAWESTLRTAFPKVAAEMGIRPTNLKWVAAYHAAEGHPHVHLVFWEKKPERTRGVVGNGERKEMRKILVNEIYAEERSRLYATKTAMRDHIREFSKNDISRAIDLVKEIRQESLNVRAMEGDTPGIPPILRDTKEKELAEKLDKLSKLMPGKGKAALAYMPEEVKREAREVADWIIKQPGFNKEIKQYMAAAEEIAKHYSNKANDIQKARDKAYGDLRDRVAQNVIRGAAKINREDGRAERERKILEFEQAKERYQERKQEINTAQVARNVWKGAWNEVERENAKIEAQAEIMKQKQIQSQEQARKYGRKPKGLQNEEDIER